MRKHLQPHPTTTIFRDNPFIFIRGIAREGLPRGGTPALGAGGPRFKSGRPDQSFQKLTGMSQKLFPALWGKFGEPIGSSPASSPLLAFAQRDTSLGELYVEE